MSISNNLHHANLVIGSLAEGEKLLHELFGPLNASPDFLAFKEATFGIDEARQLSDLSLRKAFGKRKVYLVAPEKVTLEAQNALLKTFEDPSPDTYFFLVVKEEGSVIPTLRSRMNAVRLQRQALYGEADKFFKLSIKDRLAFAKDFVDKEKNLSDFLDSLMFFLKSKSQAKNLEEVYKLRRFAGDRAASSRLVLEHLSVVL